jgi:hypothetical protein
VGPCHHGMARPQVADGGTASNMEGSCILHEQSQTADKGGPPAWGLGEVLTTPPREKQNVI